MYHMCNIINVVKLSSLTHVILTTSVKSSVPEIVHFHGWYMKP